MSSSNSLVLTLLYAASINLQGLYNNDFWLQIGTSYYDQMQFDSLRTIFM